MLATTNDFARLRASAKGRLESRFVRLHVEAPSVDETARFLARRGVAAPAARKIALGAVPEGCLATAGCNVRAALNDARALLAALGSTLTTATV